ELIVLGLGEEVDGADRGVGVVVCDDDGLSGAVDRVDADVAVDGALGEGDVDVAGADDLVDAREGLGAVGEGGDGLGAAAAEDAASAGDGRGGERDVGHAAIRGGRANDDDVLDARYPGRHDGVEYGGGVGRLSAGRVEADGLDGAHLHAQGVVLDVG